MESRKLTKADLDKVREIEGFPIADDEDIIALSDAPFYTACPNPFIEEFIAENGTPYDEATDNYHREPFAADVSEGKTDPIYMAHSYHTKVPHKAIMRYILHYTKPGDIIYDGFCGTGMTGVAAQLCRKEDLAFSYGKKDIEFGTRKVILNDLSPIATFISYNYNAHVDALRYKDKAQEILDSCMEECGWMYQTNHTPIEMTLDTMMNDTVKGTINYTVWSDVLVCPHCGREIVFYEAAFDKEKKNVKSEFYCPHCSAKLKKTDCERALESTYDESCDEIVTTTKQVPVLINYSYNGKSYEKEPDSNDLEIIKKISDLRIPYDYPTTKMMFKGEKWGDSWRAGYHKGVTKVHHFFTRRNLYVLSKIYDLIRHEEAEMQRSLIFTYEQLIWGMSKMARYVPTHYSQVNQYLSGTLYIGSQVVEVSPGYIIQKKIKNLAGVFSTINGNESNVLISTASAAELELPDNSIDYIFTDPPFGDNLMYSELSFMWESWLGVITNNGQEAIISPAQNKSVVEYQDLMTRCFTNYYKALKPNRWITVEFHNSKNAVWNAIQEALGRAGFVVADVRTLDKKQGSFKQVSNTTSVKQDLVISAYKPKNTFTQTFLSKAGSEATAWDFVQQHLENLPVVVDANQNGKIDIVTERQAFLLFDRMVAFHIMNGIPVPIDASDFYKGLEERFLKRDGMFFLPNQVNEYDTARIKMDIEPIQFELFVTNEKSAIAWLYQQLDDPQTYAEIQPKFMQEVKAVDKYEAMPELQTLLEENFLQDEKGRWYIPDVKKEADVTKLREKKLWKEFEGYLASKGKLKLFRSEAIRVGFARLWKDKNYQAIVDMAERLPEQTVQEDPNILMYYDISLSRV